MIEASFVWLPVSTYANIVNDETSVIGTCIETLDDSGAQLAAAVSTEGNYAICHWIYFEKNSAG